MRPPGCSETSAISGLPITMVAARSGSLSSLAWSRMTVTSAAGAGLGAITATAQHAKISARMSCLNTDAIEHSRAFTHRSAIHTRAAEWAGLRLRVDSKLVNELQMQGAIPERPMNRGPSMPERIDHLLTEAGGKRAVIDA